MLRIFAHARSPAVSCRLWIVGRRIFNQPGCQRRAPFCRLGHPARGQHAVCATWCPVGRRDRALFGVCIGIAVKAVFTVLTQAPRVCVLYDTKFEEQGWNFAPASAIAWLFVTAFVAGLPGLVVVKFVFAVVLTCAMGPSTKTALMSSTYFTSCRSSLRAVVVLVARRLYTNKHIRT